MPRGETTRQKIEKVNATISSLLKEMAESAETDQFIDWGDLINRLKMYRSDLEDDLTKEDNESTIEPLPEAFAQPDTDSEPTLADTTPPPWTKDWNAAKEQQYMDNPDAWSRDEGINELPLIDDDDDYIIDPTDDELLRDDDEDDVV